MSRSRKKTPVCWACCDSEKDEKSKWHRRMRATILIRLHNADPDEVILPHEREISNIWELGKCGKWRFDPSEHPELMRK